MKPTPEAVIEAIASVARPNHGDDAFVPLHAPEISGNEWRYVKECLDDEWVSTVGSYVDRFEADLAAFTGAGYAVATVNGTAALHAALILAGVRPGDEVVIPTLTFVATANAVAYCGAVPHFADCNEETLGLDVPKLAAHLERTAEIRDGQCINRETGRPIRALVCMHTFGHASDLDGLAALSERFGLFFVEDAAESLGSYYHGRHTGTFARLAAVSFNGNKIVTTGGGGAILTSDSELAKAARHLTTTAKLPHPWEFVHDRVGYNYRLPNVNAAIGCAQLEKLPAFLEEKRVLTERYRAAFAGLDGVRLLTEPEGCRSNYWLNALVLEENFAHLRDDLLSATNGAKLMTRPAWTPMHRLEMFADAPRMDLSCAESLHGRVINIPSSPRLARHSANHA